jgi:methionyl-tRNA formyltransferase
MELRPSPVKQAALEAGLEVAQPEKARDPEFAEWLRAQRADVAVVVAYGKILPGSLLEIPPLGFVNVHFSLLPAYRGAAPVQRALIEGATETGVSIMVLTEGMDEGPVLAMQSIEVGLDDTAGGVGDRLAGVGAELLAVTLPGYADGTVVPQEQDHDAATYASKLTPEDAHIKWNAHSKQIRDLVRGCNPIPGAWTALAGKRLKVHTVRPAESITALGPGETVANDEGLFAGTRDVPLELVEVQMEGRRRMTGAELVRGIRLAEGSSFG